MESDNVINTSNENSSIIIPSLVDDIVGDSSSCPRTNDDDDAVDIYENETGGELPRLYDPIDTSHSSNDEDGIDTSVSSIPHETVPDTPASSSTSSSSSSPDHYSYPETPVQASSSSSSSSSSSLDDIQRFQLPASNWQGPMESWGWQEEESIEAVDERGDLSDFIELPADEIRRMKDCISDDPMMQRAMNYFLANVIENEVVFQSHPGAKVDLDPALKRASSIEWTSLIKEFAIMRFALGWVPYGWEHDSKTWVSPFILDPTQFRVFYKFTKKSKPIFKFARASRPKFKRRRGPRAVGDDIIESPMFNGGTSIGTIPIPLLASLNRSELEIVPGIEVWCDESFRPNPITGSLKSIAKLCMGMQNNLNLRKYSRILADMRNSIRPIVTTETKTEFKDGTPPPSAIQEEMRRKKLIQDLALIVASRKRTSAGEFRTALSTACGGDNITSSSSSSSSSITTSSNESGLGSTLDYVNAAIERLTRGEPHMIHLDINKEYHESSAVTAPVGIEEEETALYENIAQLFGIPPQALQQHSNQKSVAEFHNSSIKKQLASHQRCLIQVLEHWFSTAYGPILVQSLLEHHARYYPNDPVPDKKTLDAYRHQKVSLVSTPEFDLVWELTKSGAVKTGYLKEYLPRTYHIDKEWINEKFVPPPIEFIQPKETTGPAKKKPKAR